MSSKFAHGRNIHDFFGIIGLEGEAVRNFPKENLHCLASPLLREPMPTFPSSDPEAIRESLNGFLANVSVYQT